MAASEASNTALMLASRGEFELILASLAVAAGLDSRVAPFAALYVLVLSILSPLYSARSYVPRAVAARPLVRPARAGAAVVPGDDPHGGRASRRHPGCRGRRLRRARA